MNSLWFFLPGILYLGIITSYTDIKYGKIKNRDIVIGICYAFAVYLGFIIYSLITKQGINYTYFLELCTNTFFALAIAFGLWYFKLWSAGDGKLFFAFALLVPFEVYQYGKYDWIPSLTLLFNVFIIGLFAMLLLILKNARINDYAKMLKTFFKNFFGPVRLAKSAVSLFAMFWLIDIVFSYLGWEGNRVLKYLFTFLILSLIPALTSTFPAGNKKFQIEYIELYIFGAVSVVRLVIDKSVYSSSFLVEFIMMLIIWRIFRSLMRHGLSSLSKDVFSKEISVKKLKPGMILSDKITKVKKLSKDEIKKVKDKEMIFVTKGNASYILGGYKSAKEYIDVESEGLEKEHIEKIRKTGLKKVRISTTLPFAPLLFMGVLATLLIKGNILILRYFLLK
ncbi:hypothetical protein JW707_05090 [Candidatus Woesearchaeota archaeon]|nr:hypothetical protein [Candidatus Woesearchaeota archaeon]